MNGRDQATRSTEGCGAISIDRPGRAPFLWRAMKAAVLLCAAVAIAAAPTLSQADRHDGAIRALLDDMLLSIQASGAGRGALLSEGPPHNTGAPGGGGYRVDFSGVRIAASAESTVDIGDMRLAVEALDGGRHGIAVHLATSFEVVDAAGRLRSTIKTGAQTLGAIWNPDILGFEAATARVEDIRQVDPSGDFIWRATRAEAGSVSERDLAAVARDVADGIVSKDAALADYGYQAPPNVID